MINYAMEQQKTPQIWNEINKANENFEKKKIVTYNKNKTFRFNSELLSNPILKDKEYVKVYYTLEENKIKIAFLFLEKAEEGVFKLFAKSGSGAFISGYSVMSAILSNDKLKERGLDKNTLPYFMDIGEGKMGIIIEISIESIIEKISEKNKNKIIEEIVKKITYVEKGEREIDKKSTS